MQNKLKIGKIKYLNVYPFYVDFSNNDIFEFIEGEPSYLNNLLSSNFIDISPSSSIEYLKNFNKYFLIKNLSISSTDKILSVNLLLKKNFKTLQNETIFLNPASATSNALVKIIFKKFYNINVNFKMLEHNKFQYGKNQLLIGDEALKLYFNRVTDYYLYDVAKIWQKFTKLPFVFALWIINKNSINKKKYIDAFIKELFKRKNNILIPEKYNGFNREKLKKYFKVIDYNLTDIHLQSITLFAKYCYELEILNKIPEYRWWS